MNVSPVLAIVLLLVTAHYVQYVQYIFVLGLKFELGSEPWVYCLIVTQW